LDIQPEIIHLKVILSQQISDMFSTPPTIYKICIYVNFIFLSKIDEFFEINQHLYDIAAIASKEISSNTIDSQPEDLWCAEIYLFTLPEVEYLEKKLKEFLSQDELKISFETLEEKDWVAFYYDQLKPLVLGDFFITNLSNKPDAPNGKIPIVIESSRAFGTGDHQTTAGCITAMQDLKNNKFSSILDVGTGTGILSFVASHIWADAQILACDIEEEAVSVARVNKTYNANCGNITFSCNEDGAIDYPNNYFDLIIANLLAKPIIELMPTFNHVIRDEGYLVISGFLEAQVDEIMMCCSDYGFNCIKKIIDQDWAILLLQVKKH
jgi:ribosomal protein L11 methyltransferase